MSDQSDSPDLLALTAKIVTAQLSSQLIAAAELPALIQQVHATLKDVGSDVRATVSTRGPAVPIKKSVTNAYIVCLEDGRRVKLLKRHLRTLNLSPDQYRQKWGLAGDYPMVAPEYAARRSVLAKQSGLGLKRKGSRTDGKKSHLK
jgi:predicted transcriptional regulator